MRTLRTDPSPRTIADSHLGRYRPLVDDWDAFASILCQPQAPCVWANPQRITPGGLQDLLCSEGLDPRPVAALPQAFVLPRGVRPGQQWWFSVGLAHVQELVSQLPVQLLDLHPGQRVLDLCAAPGGKTAQIACALGNRGTLIANDHSTDRIKALQGNLDRLGILDVSTTCQDGTSWPREAGLFDRILVDAPCSGEGTVRRAPSLLARLGPGHSRRLPPRQRALLRRAVLCCRPGGRIVYSTCTLAPEENECVVADILAEFPGEISLVAVTLPGIRTASGVCRWDGRSLPDELRHCVRLWPHHNDTGGFFIAVLQKHAGDESDLALSGLPGSPAAEDPRLLELVERYGLPPGYWDGYRVHRQNRRGLHLVAGDHVPPSIPQPAGSGLFIHRTNVQPPKPTTAGVLLFGQAATRRRLILSKAQRDCYLRREDLVPETHQIRDLPPGQVIAICDGHVLGMALLHRSGVVQSLFPRRWSCSAPGTS